jgi:branched-chain amino acid transport system permease protein
MKPGRMRRIVVLHLAIIGLLFLLQFVLPAYHHTNLARIMVLATFAMGYNILFGYTGLMSLGHAMFFAAGMYGAGLCVYYLQFGAGAAFVLGIFAGVALAAVFGLFALRTTGVSFLIVTMMFGQACYLTLLYFNEITLGDQGFTVWLVFAGALAISAAIAASPIGRVLIAVRANEERTRLLGYNTFAYKWLALCVSGAIAGAAGAAYALLFSYVGASFASILYSIYPLLWTLLGGAGTTIGPLVGTGVMFYLIDVTSGWTAAYLFVVGGSLLVLVLWFPRGLMGAVRARWADWLP